MPTRYICDVLDEMRACYKTRNFSHIDGLIEEAQTLANRMESKLEEYKNERRYIKQVKRIKNDIKEGKTGDNVLKWLDKKLRYY